MKTYRLLTAFLILPCLAITMNVAFAQCDSLSLAHDDELQLPDLPDIPYEDLEQLQLPEFQYGEWSELSVYPEHRHSSGAAYDPLRARLIVFGGSNGIASNDLWSLDMSGVDPVWSRMDVSGIGPEARAGHTMVYDALRDRMIVFGGQLPASQGVSNELWELDLSSEPRWQQLGPIGSMPQGRAYHACIYDPVQDRLILFGGMTATGQWLGDVWECDLSSVPAWTQLTPAGIAPAARGFHAMVYDSAEDRAIVYGGWNGTRFGDLWELTLDGSEAWSALSTSGAAPSERSAVGAVYDPINNELVIFGGRTNFGRSNELFAVSLSGSRTWREVSAPDPRIQGRSSMAMLYDPTDESLVLYGGFSATGYALEDAWKFPLRTPEGWLRLPPEWSLPHGRAAHSFTYNSVEDDYILYGNDFSDEANAVWLLTMENTGTEEIERWSKLTVPGVEPTVRGEHGAVYDEKRNRLIIAMGTTFDESGAAGLDDTWALNFDGIPNWELLDSGSGPSPRGGATMVHDLLRDRLVLFGGSEFGTDGNRYWKNDTWVFDLSDPFANWEPLPVSGPLPQARADHMMIYDPVRDQVVLFGGSPIWGSVLDDTWVLKFGAENRWQRQTIAGLSPSARSAAAAIYDPIRDRMVITGGADPEPVSDTWELSFLPDGPAWSLVPPTSDVIAPPRGVGVNGGTYDSYRDRFVAYGGASYWHYRNTNTWALTWGLGSLAPGETAILGAFPRTIAANGPGSIVVSGVGFEAGSTVAVRQGAIEVEPIVSAMSPDGRTIFGNFEFADLIPGTADLVVSGPGGKTNTIADAITVDEESWIEPQVTISGRNRFRPGTETVVNITCTNRGNSTVPAVPLFIKGFPANSEVRALSGLLELNEAENDVEHAPGALLEMFPTYEDSTKFSVCLLVSNLSPAYPVRVALGVTVPDNQNFVLKARWAPTVFWGENAKPARLGRFGSESTKQESCMAALGNWAITEGIGQALPDHVGCGWAIGQGIGNLYDTTQEIVQHTDTSFAGSALDALRIGTNIFSTFLSTAESCAGVLPPGTGVREVHDAFMMGWGAGTVLAKNCGVADAIADGLYDLFGDDHEMDVAVSIDPNEILGPVGVGSNRNIRAEAALSYRVMFENLPAATAAAQTVVITEFLDPTIYDLASLSFGEFVIASKRTAVAPGRRELNDVVDLRDEMGVFVVVQATINDATGILTWRFLTVDPETCGLPTDPEMGFLPPNLTSPEGEGSVSFDVRLRDDLQSGAEVRTGASIVFDANEAIDTGDWVNTLDISPPLGQMESLAAEQDSTSFVVQWSGTDAESGIAGYAIFVSVNGGPFEVWQRVAEATSAVFDGEYGQNYSFYCVAVDRVGNIEIDSGVAEATTTVVSPAVDLYFHDTMLVLDSPDGPGNPFLGMDLKIGAWIANEGEVEATAIVRFEFENEQGERELIEAIPVTVAPLSADPAGVWAEANWSISDLNTTLYCTIVDVAPEDSDPSNNFTSRLLTENTVGTFVADFDIVEDSGDIIVAWVARVASQADRFRMVGEQGDREWSIPVQSISAGAFSALDRLENRTSDETVVYTLYYEEDDGTDSPVWSRSFLPSTVKIATELRSIRPNPFNPITNVHFTVKDRQRVQLTVYNLAGHRIATLADRVYRRGRHMETWRGTDESGRGVPSGVYLIRMQGETHQETRKVMLVR